MINAKFSESKKKCMFITDFDSPSKHHNVSKNRSSQTSRVDFFKKRQNRESLDFINATPIDRGKEMLQTTGGAGPTRNNFWDPQVSKDSLDMNLERQF